MALFYKISQLAARRQRRRDQGAGLEFKMIMCNK